MPVLLEGRVQPWDSVAKNTLLMFRGKASVVASEKPVEELSFAEKRKAPKLTPTEWLLEVMTRPEAADTRHIFRVDKQVLLIVGFFIVGFVERGEAGSDFIPSLSDSFRGVRNALDAQTVF